MSIFSVYHKIFYKYRLLFKFKLCKNDIYLQNNLTKHLLNIMQYNIIHVIPKY